MQFLADENFPGEAVERLRATGHDVVWVRTDAPGSPDDKVLGKGLSRIAFLLTFDKDFGELAWRADLPSACGIILFRIRMPAPTGIGVAEKVASRGDSINAHRSGNGY
jgi:predicted nuclease of predicted toxin-antitoxin system